MNTVVIVAILALIGVGEWSSRKRRRAHSQAVHDVGQALTLLEQCPGKLCRRRA